MICLGWFGCLEVALANTDLPFTQNIEKLKEAISGPFLLAVSVIMVVITSIMMAFGEWGEGFKKMINMVFWFSIAFSASSFITTLFGSGVGY